jgi:Ca2+-binding RTX toxin-like protein
MLISGTSSDDTINGTESNDELRGLAGADTLNGGGGDDLLIGGAGADTLNGGAGTDTASYVGSLAGVTVTLATPGTAGIGGDAAGDKLYGIENLVGTSYSDTLTGDAFANLLSGGGGADYLSGGGGDDTLDGGLGDDDLDGGAGHDIVLGGGGVDTLRDTLGGSDQLSGGDGNDHITVTRNSQTVAFGTLVLDGGAGNDRMSYNGTLGRQDTVTMIGGIGNDTIIASVAAFVLNIDAGDGIDRVEIGTGRGTQTITLGLGADTLHIGGHQLYFTGYSTTVTDFATGAAGDQLSLQNYLSGGLTGWDGAANPFATGHLRLVQSGTGVLLEIDRNGGGDSYELMVTFQNADALTFTGFNLGGFPSDGTLMAGTIITGTAGNDNRVGTGGADTFYGLGGFDDFKGGFGDDWIEGGDGSDGLDGELGNDMVFGDGGNDYLTDTLGGNDQLFGGDGNDTIDVGRWIATATSTLLLDGGAGDDTLTYRGQESRQDNVTMVGGTGADRIEARQAYAGTVTIDAGAGIDRVTIDANMGSYTLTLGSEADTVVMNYRAVYSGQVSTPGHTAMLDFETGGTGDKIDMKAFLSGVLTGWTSTGNPFASGHLRLLQQGSDTLLQLDSNGGGDSFSTFVTFQNSSAAAFTAYNLGYDPLYAPQAQQVSPPDLFW